MSLQHRHAVREGTALTGNEEDVLMQPHFHSIKMATPTTASCFLQSSAGACCVFLPWQVTHFERNVLVQLVNSVPLQVHTCQCQILLYMENAFLACTPDCFKITCKETTNSSSLNEKNKVTLHQITSEIQQFTCFMKGHIHMRLAAATVWIHKNLLKLLLLLKFYTFSCFG